MREKHTRAERNVIIIIVITPSSVFQFKAIRFTYAENAQYTNDVSRHPAEEIRTTGFPHNVRAHSKTAGFDDHDLEKNYRQQNGAPDDFHNFEFQTNVADSQL